MDDLSRVHAIATEACITFTKLYENSHVFSGAGAADGNIGGAVLDCFDTNKRIILAVTDQQPNQTAIAVGHKNDEHFSMVGMFEISTLKVSRVLEIMEQHFAH